MFTPAERKEVRLESTAPSHRESSDVPVPFQAGTYPWVRREPHSMVCGNTASHCARHKQRKGDCSGPMGASPIPHGPSPPNRLPDVSVYQPGLVELGGVRGGLAYQNCHCGQWERARACWEAVLLAAHSSLSKGMKSTGKTQAPQILAGEGPTG